MTRRRWLALSLLLPGGLVIAPVVGVALWWWDRVREQNRVTRRERIYQTPSGVQLRVVK